MQMLELRDFPGWAERLRRPYHDGYYAMYSSVFDGIVTDPVLMVIPADDHMVHRGDGVFETFKCVGGRLYNMKAHLDRIVESAASIELTLPVGRAEMERIVLETVKAGGRRDCLVRLFLARGPGGFGVSPYECPAAQLYVGVVKLPPPFMAAHPGGARVFISSQLAKPPELARSKNCNYLQNALMKKEALDAGADFAVCFDERGFLAEGATESFGIVTADRRLLFPHLDRILSGTTMMRVLDLAGAAVADGTLAGSGFEDISRDAFLAAPEVLIFGTTTDVTAVVSVNGTAIGGGVPGPVFGRLQALLAGDIRENERVLTPVW